jgi:lantibiotic modifying enzyme
VKERLATGNQISHLAPERGAAPLTGLSHNASGIGLALFELYASTGRRGFLETARGAFAYEDSLFDANEGNWPDLRFSADQTHFARLWCHGAPGIALARLRAATLDPDHAKNYIELARIALATTIRAIEENLAEPRPDASLCHGLAGLGEVCLFASQSLNDPSYREVANSLADELISRYATTGDWPSGAPSGGPNPSLMLGLAGIGYWFLRLHDMEQVASVLLVTP